MKKPKTILIILDGWGIGKNNNSNPIKTAKTKNFDYYKKNYAYSQLKASGQAVGLPENTMGNSEVGHLHLGAGRVIDQHLLKINRACLDGSFLKNKVLLEAISKAKKRGSTLHLIGLASDAGVHSHLNHLYKICELTEKKNIKNVFIHAITDGRDTDPKSGLKYIKQIETKIKQTNIRIASLIGRYYAMDRDKRWERTKKAYDMLVSAKGKKVVNLKEAIKESYDKGETDEFIKPIVITNEKGQALTKIKNNDVVICFNFRVERLRQLTIALSQKNLSKISSKALALNYYTLTRYDDYKKVKVIFEQDLVCSSLGEVLAKNNLKQLRIAETEKYAHVTSFFSGGRKEKFKYEDRILVNSPKVATYDLKPEMSADLITEKAIKEIKKQKYDFICLNYANLDMVAHTGKFKAIEKAIEVVDDNLGKLLKEALNNNYQAIVTADHGNAEVAVNSDGSPNTNHSLNPVPCIVISSKYRKIKNGALYNIAPSLLKIMEIKKPNQMKEKDLF